MPFSLSEVPVLKGSTAKAPLPLCSHAEDIFLWLDLYSQAPWLYLFSQGGQLLFPHILGKTLALKRQVRSPFMTSLTAFLSSLLLEAGLYLWEPGAAKRLVGKGNSQQTMHYHLPQPSTMNFSIS